MRHLVADVITVLRADYPVATLEQLAQYGEPTEVSGDALAGISKVS